MKKRFEILNHNQNIYVSNNCPLIMKAHAITKDTVSDKLLAQCKFENLENNNIIAFYIKVLCYSVDGVELASTDNFSYLDLNITQYKEFGDKVPVPIKDKDTRKTIIIPEKIVFSDKSVWINESKNKFIELPKDLISIESLGELSSQYKRNLKDHINIEKLSSHTTLLYQGEVYAICGCGKTVLNYESTCPNCGVNFKVLEELNNKEVLIKDLDQYNLEQEKSQEYEKKLKLENKIKRKKKYTIIMAVVGSLIILALISASLIKPFIIYKSALNDINNKEFDIAEKKLDTLGDYKDSIEMRNSAIYESALNDFREEKLDSTERKLDKLGEYKDSVKIMREIEYQKAIIKYHEGDFRGALSDLERINKREDSKKYIDTKELEQYIKKIKDEYSFYFNRQGY